ncbi:unnamed protein product [Brassica rapa]|uniref:Uncharacterized protein n=1 Tax=Brassica campestris TaxID=3711 RepID=A0A3P6A393_BRACM|nr:unnamed protein product [Brassica rapa]VDC84139.1 unnamed protein product [Brassica rapa]
MAASDGISAELFAQHTTFDNLGLGRASQDVYLNLMINLDGCDLEKTSYSYQDESNNRAPKVVSQSEQPSVSASDPVDAATKVTTVDQPTPPSFGGEEKSYKRYRE